MPLGAILFGSMVAGGVASAFSSNSASAISTACDNWDQYEKQYKETLSNWNDIIKGEYTNKTAARDLGISLSLQAIKYKNALSNLKDKYKQQETSYIIGLAIFIFVVLISLLFKYFNVIPSIWNYITK